MKPRRITYRRCAALRAAGRTRNPSVQAPAHGAGAQRRTIWLALITQDLSVLRDLPLKYVAAAAIDASRRRFQA